MSSSNIISKAGNYFPGKDINKSINYILIDDTPFEQHVLWPSDIECLIKLTFSESD